MMKANLSQDEGIDIDNFDIEAEIESFKDFVPSPLKIAIRLYTAPKQLKSGLYIPDAVHDNQQYESHIGLVFAKGSGCYKDERYKNTGPWCEVGDWVAIPRHSGNRMVIDGKPVFIVWEDAIDAVVNDPRRVGR